MEVVWAARAPGGRKCCEDSGSWVYYPPPSARVNLFVGVDCFCSRNLSAGASVFEDCSTSCLLVFLFLFFLFCVFPWEISLIYRAGDPPPLKQDILSWNEALMFK